MVGKNIGDAVYLHRKYTDHLAPELKTLYIKAETLLCSEEKKKWNLLKVNFRKSRVSFLYYPQFDLEAHPELAYTIHVNLDLINPRSRIIKGGGKILHRKELFVGQDYYLYEKFSQLTQEEEKLNLLDTNAKFKGKRLGNIMGQRIIWEEWLKSNGVLIKSHTIYRI